jgi:hypothetical protein
VKAAVALFEKKEEGSALSSRGSGSIGAVSRGPAPLVGTAPVPAPPAAAVPAEGTGEAVAVGEGTGEAGGVAKKHVEGTDVVHPAVTSLVGAVFERVVSFTTKGDD